MAAGQGMGLFTTRLDPQFGSERAGNEPRTPAGGRTQMQLVGNRTLFKGGVLVLVCALPLAGGLLLRSSSRQESYFLATRSHEGIEKGDAVTQNGLRIGEVLGVEATGVSPGIAVEFRLDGDQVLYWGDLVWLRRSVRSSPGEVRVFRNCLTVGGPPPGAVPFGRSVQEASLAERTATSIRCSRSGRWLEDQALPDFRETLRQLRAEGSEAWESGRENLEKTAEELLEEYEESGLQEKADSLRALISEHFKSG